MKKIIFGFAVLFSAFFALPASATLYDFSYVFNDGAKVTGSLTGNLLNGYVQNVADVQFFVNGVQSTGHHYAVNYNPTSYQWENTVNATVSTDALSNNFLFINSNYPVDYGYTNYFYMINFANNFNSQVYVWDALTGSNHYDYGVNNSWTLTAEVPEPGTYALILTGLGLLGFMARRKKGQPV